MYEDDDSSSDFSDLNDEDFQELEYGDIPPFDAQRFLLAYELALPWEYRPGFRLLCERRLVKGMLPSCF